MSIGGSPCSSVAIVTVSIASVASAGKDGEFCSLWALYVSRKIL